MAGSVSQASRTGTVRCEHCGKLNRVPAAGDGVPRCGNCHQALPWIVPAGDDDFAEIAERASMAVLVDLWAPWCVPCRQVSPALERIARDLAGQLKLVKVNVDGAEATARRFNARSIPTLLLMRHGEVVDQQVGAAAERALRSWIDGTLGRAS
jgi:thioredoxin 2